MPIPKKKKFQIISLKIHLKDLEKQELTRTQISRRKEITKIRVEISKADKNNDNKYQKNTRDQRNKVVFFKR
jgi:hypothetical protein